NLGDGWHGGYFGFTGKRALYGPNPRLLAQLQLDYADGTSETIVTDESWKAAHGALREGDLLMGATYDARREIAGWNSSGFDDAGWQNATVIDPPPKIELDAHPGDPVRKIEELKPKKIAEPQPGTYVFDLGQNMVGWVRLKSKAAEGQKITLRYAEMLNPDGTLYTTALRSARATDTYIGRGGSGGGAAEFEWEPKFTFHGFRYVELTGVT